jgi:hypothetical protein
MLRSCADDGVPPLLALQVEARYMAAESRSSGRAGGSAAAAGSSYMQSPLMQVFREFQGHCFPANSRIRMCRRLIVV